MTGKKFGAISLIFMLIVGCTDKKEKTTTAKEDPPVVVDVLVAQPSLLSSTIEANGTVVAGEFLEVRPEVSGRITYLNIPEGSMVSQGTVLARLNDAELRAQLGKSTVQLSLAEKTLERYNELLNAGGINQNDVDIALNQANALKADIAYTQALIQKTVIKAPFTGKLGLRQVSMGAYVSPSTVLATLQQVSAVKVDFTLPESDAGTVHKGDTIQIQLGENETRNRARILAIEPGANIQTRNLTVRAMLIDSVPNPGAFAKIIIPSVNPQQAIEVPTASIIPNDRTNQVVMVKDGKAIFKDVVTGMRLANTVAVKEGLSAGDTVVVTGVLFVRPNSKVKIGKVKTLADVVGVKPQP
jgi:membrane fusion protein, multidrug efflux system